MTILLVGGMLAAGVLRWCLRHPVLVGFVAVSVVAALAGPWWLAGWWALMAAVVAAVGVERAPSEGLLRAFVVSVCRLAWWFVRHPLISWLLAGSLLAVYHAGPAGLGALWGWLAGVGLVWRWLWPATWHRWVVARLRAGWRTLVVYTPRWARTLEASGLTQRLRGDERRVVPRRLQVVSPNRWADRVTVELLAGQSPEVWDKAAGSLASSWGAEECKVHRVNPRRHAVELVLRRGDPLAAPIPAPSPVPVEGLDLSALPVGVTEWGDPWQVRLHESHVLVAGWTGAGKGSVVGALLTALAPAVGAGLVEVYGLDPKGGVELSLVEPMFCRLAWDPTGMVELLEDLAGEMQDRLAAIRGQARRYTLSEAQPHKLIVVDELAWLTSYAADRKLRDRATAALGALLSQGRAPGYSVVGLVQDPRKDTLPMRDLFTTRVALRLPEPAIVDTVLGDGSYRRGAWCDRIPATTPGVGYVLLDTDPEPQRIRAAWCDDDHLRHLASQHPTPRPAVVDTTATTAATGPRPAPAFDDDDHDDLGAWDTAA